MLKKENLPSRFLLIPWVVLILGLALTYALQETPREANRQALHNEFEYRSNEIVENINRRLQNYEQVLEGVAGLFTASHTVTQEEFSRYVETLKFEDKFPGIQGVGFARYVTSKEKAAYIATMRANGSYEYDIRPSGEREIYAPITYLQPPNWRNQRAIGYDMYSETVRRAALNKAIEENKAIISGRVKLVQETDQDIQAGFLMYMPIYRLHSRHNNINERHENIEGWVYAPFRMNDLMAGILGRQFDESSSPFRMNIYDGNSSDHSQLMYESRQIIESHDAVFRTVKSLDLFGHQWNIVISSLPTFDARLKSDRANIIAITGSFASVLLTIVVWLLVTGRDRALAIARSMTSELRKSEAEQKKLNRALRLISDCNIALSRSESEHHLLSEICRLCVDNGGYLMAWVGYAEQDEAKTVRPVAQAGYESGYLETINISWGNNPQGLGPTGTAIRTGTPHIIQNILTNASMAPWRKAALERGYQSSVSLPLICDAKILGALNIYSCEAEAFDPAEVQLLEELVDDIAYCIVSLRTRAENAETREKLEFLTNFDPLTNLPNRLLLRDRFDHAVIVANNENITVNMLYIDLDHFKQINDSLGYAIGDQLLIEVANRLQHCIPATATMSRLSGDEFVILLTGKYDVPGIAEVGNTIREAFSTPFSINNDVINLSCSVGIGLYPLDGDDFDTLLKHAHTALNSAKEAGRNTYRFFTRDMNAGLVEQIRLTGGLSGAVRNNEFTLHYQPQIDIKSGKIIAAEALIRWLHPIDGLIAPGKFIGLAERSGHIIQIGEWVINEACRHARVWQDQYPVSPVVAVNLSALQFKHGDILKIVANALAVSGLRPELLELELTESILLQDVETTIKSLHGLKELGVKLSIDDFGTGYSSLSYLKRLSVDKLKIDQSFVRDMLNDTDGASIVKAIIQLGHTLQLIVIAEGVETAAQLAFLAESACDEAQGYLFSRPVPVEQFVQLIEQGDKK